MPDHIVVPLHDGWTLHQERRADNAPAIADVSAVVPGCVHTDLLDHHLIPDPFVNTQEDDVAWVAACDWRYACVFQVTQEQLDHECLELAFDGLDTLATISVNGTEIATTANMHRRYRFEVGALATTGPNSLEIVFASATEHCDSVRDTEGVWPSSSFGRPFNYLRKMACSWGWDWGPWLTTAGIWRPVKLHAWSHARLGDIRPRITIDPGDHGGVAIDIDTIASNCGSGARTRAVLRSLDGATIADEIVDVTVGTTKIVLDAGVVQRWWPHTHGDQPLYQLDVTMICPDDSVCDHRTVKIGFRTIELDTTADATGSAFTFVVNGVPIVARGVNWIPDDIFVTRVTEADYRQRLQQAVDANVDIVRIWGGGIYEDDRFYDTCDELGILVWQDFLFACAAYPEHLLADEVEAEAYDNVSRLMRHTSLAIWNGNNENIWGYWDWAWQDILQGRSWGAGFYFDLLPRITTELDPLRPYWAGSPYSGSQTVAPNADAQGCVHVWDVWNQVDFVRYRDHAPRFVAEFGWQAPPAWPTMADAVTPDQFEISSPAMRNHQKATDGDIKLERGIKPRFGTVGNLETWWYAAQLLQARAVQTGIEHFRSLRPYCMGTIWWQLNDCWPVASWAVIDGAGRQKPAWYALQQAYRSRLLTIQPRGDQLVVFALNETADDWAIDTSAERRRFDGSVIASTPVALAVGAHSSASFVLPSDVAQPDDPSDEVLVVGAQADRAWWWFAPDRELTLRQPNWHVSHVIDGDDLVLALTTDTVVRDLAIYPERISSTGRTDRQLVCLLPGETEKIRLSGVSAADLPALLAQPACWSVADVIAD